MNHNLLNLLVEQSFFLAIVLCMDFSSSLTVMLKQGDNVALEWPGIGYVEYKIINSTIVQQITGLSIEQAMSSFLLHVSIGFSQGRLIIKGRTRKTYQLKLYENKFSETFALIIIIAFSVGTILSSTLYKKKSYSIFMPLNFNILLGAWLFLPTPPDTLESNISRISDLIGLGF